MIAGICAVAERHKRDGGCCGSPLAHIEDDTKQPCQCAQVLHEQGYDRARHDMKAKLSGDYVAVLGGVFSRRRGLKL